MEVKHFASVAEAVAHFDAQGFKTVLYDAGINHARLMRNRMGEIAVIHHVGLLDAQVRMDDGYWEDKLADWASDGADFFTE